MKYTLQEKTARPTHFFFGSVCILRYRAQLCWSMSISSSVNFMISSSEMLCSGASVRRNAKPFGTGESATRKVFFYFYHKLVFLPYYWYLLEKIFCKKKTADEHQSS